MKEMEKQRLSKYSRNFNLLFWGRRLLKLIRKYWPVTGLGGGGVKEEGEGLSLSSLYTGLNDEVQSNKYTT